MVSLDWIFTLGWPVERKVAEQWDVTFCPYIEEPTVCTLSWAVQDEQGAIARTLALYPLASEIKAKKIKDLTNWLAWLTHPDGYMYE